MSVATLSRADAVWHELVELANAQYTSREYQALMGVPLSRARAQQWQVHLAKFTLNRRDCWGYVQGAAPLDVKRIIWDHEEEELIGERASGKLDHYTLAMKEGELLGLTPEDFDRIPVCDGARTCFYAWELLARERPWLEGFAASAMLEVRNSGDLIEGGAMSYRRGKKLEADLGIPLKKQINNEEHIVADVRHATLLMQVAEVHATRDEDWDRILRGARESLAIDRVLWAHIADTMLQVP